MTLAPARPPPSEPAHRSICRELLDAGAAWTDVGRKLGSGGRLPDSAQREELAKAYALYCDLVAAGKGVVNDSGWLAWLHAWLQAWLHATEERDSDAPAALVTWRACRLEVLRILSKVGFMPIKGWLPIHQAARLDREDAVRALLDAWPDCVRQQAPSGDLPLHLAVQSGHEQIVQMLLAAFPDGAMECGGGSLPIHTAVFRGHVAVVRALLAVWPEGAGMRTSIHRDLPIEVASSRARRIADVADVAERRAHVDMVRALLAAWPAAARERRGRNLLIHMEVMFPYPGCAGVVQALLEVWPESVWERDQYDRLPITAAMRNWDLITGRDMARTLLTACPELLLEDEVWVPHVHLGVETFFPESWPGLERVLGRVAARRPEGCALDLVRRLTPEAKQRMHVFLLCLHRTETRLHFCIPTPQLMKMVWASM